MIVNSKLSNCHLVGIELKVVDSTTNNETVVTLHSTPITGVFHSRDWETNGLAPIVQNKGFVMKALSEPIDGGYVGLEINIPSILATLTDEADKASFISLARHICIDRQIALTPALAYATEIDPAYTPTKCEICKSCQFKRRCHFYRQG